VIDKYILTSEFIGSEKVLYKRIILRASLRYHKF